MKSNFIHRFRRHNATRPEGGFFKKQNQESFFGETVHESFFPSPAVVPKVQRKCEGCAKEDKKVQRVGEKIGDIIEHGPPSPEPPITDVTKDEAKEDTVTTPVLSPGSGCTPIAVDRNSFLAKTGNNKKLFGLTPLDPKLVAHPGINPIVVKGGFRLDTTDAFLPDIPSYYTKEGEFIEGDYAILTGKSRCDEFRASKKYPIKWVITASGAAAIEKGEKDHCKDYQYAFDISLKKYRDAVNEFARKKTVFKNLQDCNRRLRKKTGVHPGNWIAVFKCLYEKTMERDPKNSKDPNEVSLHTPKPKITNPDQITDPLQDCRYFIHKIDGGSLPNVGKPEPSGIIKDCGE